MGYGGLNSTDYSAGVDALRSSGKQFARSAQAATTGNYSKADALNPRKLKNGMRESCYAPGCTDVLPIVVAIDGTGSMNQVPVDIQKELPKLIELVIEQGISDHPNVLFMCHDDEIAMSPDAVFQMSQFEIGTKELISSLNEMIIPGNGGGNQGESYHLPFYAVANHTRLESFEREGKKGYFFIICDEQPIIYSGNARELGTSPAIAKECFGDVIEKEIPMVESVKKAAEKYHIFVIRPHHTCHGQDRNISKLWQTLLNDAGCNPEHVLEIPETKDIIPTMAMAIGRLNGEDADDLVQVLKSKGVSTAGAAKATSSIVPFSGSGLAKTGSATGKLVTADTTHGGRERR